MTLALSTDQTLPTTTPVDLLSALHEAVSDWRDAGSVASAAVDLLRSAIPAAAATVHRYDPDSEALVVLATEPQGRGEPAIGARLILEDGVLAAAARTGDIQRAINS